jgi:hypothetical protein
MNVDNCLLTDIFTNLKHFPVDKLSHTPPIKPNGGELFVYVGKEGNWKADQYQWRMKGQREFDLPDVDLHISKRYDWVRGQNNTFVNDFTRNVYTCSSVPNVVVIHYLGDSSVYRGKAHGNCKRTNAPEFRRTCPSVLNEIKQKVSSKSSTKVYQELVTNTTESAYQGVLNPRNVGQVKNIKKAMNTEKRLSKDDLYNTVQLAYHLKDFVHQITVYPDLVCIVGVKCILDEFDKVLQVKSNEPVLCSYDTTFQLGDFYVSPLLFRHILFDGSPVIPLGFLVHERKFQNVHEQFSMMKKHVPHLRKDSLHVPIVVDREVGITNAIEGSCPFDVHCWNHIKRDLRFWLRSHGATSDDVKVYSDNLSSLLCCESESEFDEMVGEMLPKWSEAMVDHFNSSLKSELKTYSCRWVLETAKVYNPYSGVTNNCSESLNAVLKRLFDWKEVPLDVLILSLYYLQNFYVAEIQRGLAGIGDYRLEEEFHYARIDVEDINIPESVCHPDKIVDLVKGEIEFGRDIACDNINDTTICENYSGRSSETDGNSNSAVGKVSSQKSLALDVLKKNGVVHVPSLGAFLVQGSKGDKYAVSLFPKEKCQCPSTSTCYHIIAAKLSVGMDDGYRERTYNLSQLRRNSRKRTDKKSGKKQPRPLDNDISTVAPAPDSSIRPVRCKYLHFSR